MEPFEASVRDGRVVRVRAVASADDAELVQAFDRLGSDARYMRFMRVVHQVDEDRLRQVLASFPDRGIGLVATVPAADGIDIVGSALAVFADGQTGCEFAVTVASAFAGVGLAKLLMSTLIDAARSRGMAEMEGFVLSVNRPMLRLAERLGFSIAADPDDPTIRVCRLVLGAPRKDAETATGGYA